MIGLHPTLNATTLEQAEVPWIPKKSLTIIMVWLGVTKRTAGVSALAVVLAIESPHCTIACDNATEEEIRINSLGVADVLVLPTSELAKRVSDDVPFA
jgi:hypothetical protein